MLYDVGAEVARRGEALPRGATLSETVPLPPAIAALYATIPTYLPDGLELWLGSDPPTLLIGLVAVTIAERDFIETIGWKAFENLLVEQDPDLLNLDRSGVRLN